MDEEHLKKEMKEIPQLSNSADSAIEGLPAMSHLPEAKATAKCIDIITKEPNKPFIPFMVLPQNAADAVEVLSDSDLLLIGQQIQQYEAEVIALEEEKKREWKQQEGPAKKKVIDELESEIALMTSRLEKEKHMGETHIELVESLIAENMKKQDAEKRAYYFPNSRHTIGEGGIYMAFDDCRVEDISGSFDVALTPGMGEDSARMSFLLSGMLCHEWE